MSVGAISRPVIIATALASVVAGASGYAWKQSLRPRVLEIYVFALKSSQAVFIRTPSDKRILINGGMNNEIIRYISKVMSFISRRLDMLIASDTKDKNVSGLIDVLERYIIEKAYVLAVTLTSLGMSSSTDRAYDIFLDELRRQRIHMQELMAGDSVVFDDFAENYPVTANILFPQSAEVFDYSKASAPEIVINISYGSTSVMILGGANKKIQNHIASSSVLDVGHSSVIVVSHSALPANMSKHFVDLARPDFIIYSRRTTSSQKNKKSSPKKIQTDPLSEIKEEKRFNVKETGVVKIVSDGNTIVVENVDF